MSFSEYVDVAFTTTAGGAATVYAPISFRRILDVVYVYGDAATGADFVITGEDSGRAVLTVTNAGVADALLGSPRMAVQSVANAALTYDATQPVTDYIMMPNERVKIVVAQGGATKTGTIRIIYG